MKATACKNASAYMALAVVNATMDLKYGEGEVISNKPASTKALQRLVKKGIGHETQR